MSMAGCRGDRTFSANLYYLLDLLEADAGLALGGSMVDRLRWMGQDDDQRLPDDRRSSAPFTPVVLGRTVADLPRVSLKHIVGRRPCGAL